MVWLDECTATGVAGTTRANGKTYRGLLANHSLWQSIFPFLHQLVSYRSVFDITFGRCRWIFHAVIGMALSSTRFGFISTFSVRRVIGLSIILGLASVPPVLPYLTHSVTWTVRL
ncbi:hypothetical protein F5I97DRAFT_1222003 [Phlebopus sp. FC_14]|nr:hypothetical protein F5I97DRAFT_1222003 [Phlebopus sp. FC_14]